MKFLLILAFAILPDAWVFAQDPVHWSFTARKTGYGKYQLHLTATVDAPWHTYSQTTPEGGPLPTRISINKNPLVMLTGTVKEVGELHLTHDKTFDVDVKSFAGKVDYIQELTLKGKVKTNITGEVEYMACNDVQCLSPKKILFTIVLP
jgi:hypothetical protein